MKDHIDTLTALLAGKSAIDLMNAAKPLDETAERERCEALPYDLTHREQIEQRIVDRAQARAEGYAQGAARYQTAQITLSNQLSAARAELGTAEAEYQRLLKSHTAARDQLAAAQAEIAGMQSIA